MAWDKDAAVAYLVKHAGAKSRSECATYTRQAISAGGINLIRTGDAKDYGDSLLKAGFTALPASAAPEKGDVAIIQPYPGGNISGHMTMFDGKNWYSDFKQRDMYPGPGYRRFHPPYVIYRKK
ncbi:hypothetical protein GA0061071_103133 [Kosakonia oryzendophytica]|uniref:NlpC/P60 family protein n=1 Tax=Kosakonia oryzendophytica TaxID=1005665 RepID=A0A1C4AKP4_9ENTR|nr:MULTISPECIES: hypothetical protein [Kosakonia]AMO50201.1 cytoplasmic protein [Enterobacter sp. FY-07]TDT60631.1 hypothetical protein DFO53_2264 [Enterobacter sp. AG5470]UXY09877.1 hypothetical protein N7922_18750 [Kosakonia sp. ML.JS2a]WBT60676.1 hypothetical protein O9K67_18840 [Kosakonia oryzendophytica]SCB95111.1 hypothetical protein GA0061071_103133 [Kosakonia oryzendophytica]